MLDKVGYDGIRQDRQDKIGQDRVGQGGIGRMKGGLLHNPDCNGEAEPNDVEIKLQKNLGRYKLKVFFKNW